MGDVWEISVIAPIAKERTGYPTQKPLPILERIVRVHSRPGDRVLDAFAGSGTTGEAAWRHGRAAVLVDENPQAIEVMRRRLEGAAPRLGQEVHTYFDVQRCGHGGLRKAWGGSEKLSRRLEG